MPMLVDAILVLMLLLAGVALGLLVGSVLWRRRARKPPQPPRVTSTPERMSAAALSARRPDADPPPPPAGLTATHSSFDPSSTTTEIQAVKSPGADTDEIAPWDLSGAGADRGAWKSASGRKHGR